MRAAYITIGDPRDVHAWSGLNVHIARSLEEQGVALTYVGPLRDPYAYPKKFVSRSTRALQRGRYLPERSHLTARSFARQASRRLHEARADLIFSTGTIPIAFLESDLPIAFWSDQSFATGLGFYPDKTNVWARSVRAGNIIEARGLERAGAAFYASAWAGDGAIASYGVDPDKVFVVPFGPNLPDLPNRAETEALISSRPRDRCRLLFVGVDWYRKGGDVAIEVAKRLNESGMPTELVVVGAQVHDAPPFVSSRGFISKATHEGRDQLRKLFGSSHFLIHPARAEAYGVVFAEASAFGVPSVASDVGGIPSAVRHGHNGYVLPASADAAAYADVILGVLPDRYEGLARSAFNEHEERLNWTVAGKTIVEILRQL